MPPQMPTLNLADVRLPNSVGCGKYLFTNAVQAVQFILLLAGSACVVYRINAKGG